MSQRWLAEYELETEFVLDSNVKNQWFELKENVRVFLREAQSTSHEEEIVECNRDIETLRVIGGVIWGNNTADDFFLSSHGVATPDAFWKVVIGKDRVIAWIVPNGKEAKRKKLDWYLVSVAEIERVTGEIIPIPETLKSTVLARSWKIPRGCNKG